MFNKKKSKSDKEPAGYKKSEEKAEKFIENTERLISLFKEGSSKAKKNKEKIPFWDDLQSLLRMINAYVKGEYREVATGTIIAVIAAVIYFVTPIDIIPDFIPLLGFTDDAAIIAFVANRISTELEEFRDWEGS